VSVDMQRSDQPAHAAALAYLRDLEQGTQDEPDSYTSSLAPAEREEFEDLIDTVAWARSRFPCPLRPQHVIAERYELRAEIGAGGFGKVWSAFDRKLETEVAVKVMNLLTNSSIESEFFHTSERTALTRIKHPGTVQILDAGREDDTFYLVMEMLEGVSLDAVIERLAGDGANPSARALREAVGLEPAAGAHDLLADDDYFRCVARITEEMLRTLEAVHGENVVHRDIKPPNVMLRGGGQPVFLDFGMASLRDENRNVVTGRLIGTMTYLAPEQMRAHQVGADPKTDLYQVGLVLYELLTLSPAFGTKDSTTIVERIRRGSFDKPRKRNPDVPRELEDICLRAIEVDPARRYASAAAFREDLGRWLAGREAPSASRRSWFRDARYVVRRHRTATIAAAALALGLAPALVMAASGGAIHIEKVRLSSATSIAADVTASADAVVFAWIEYQDGNEKAILPLEARGGGDRPGARVSVGSGTIEFQTPDGFSVAHADYPESWVQTFDASDPTSVAQLETAWAELVRGTKDVMGPGLSERAALNVLQKLVSQSRGGVGEGAPMEPGLMVGGGNFASGGVGAARVRLR
jgi:hypothetical protein